jgi:hypothetical protein
MGRIGLIALLCGLALTGGAHARSGTCPGVDLETLVAGVPYLDRAMRREPGGDGAITFVHKDDSRLRLSVSVDAATPADPAMRRSEYLAARRAELLEGGKGHRPGADVQTSVTYSDPVSWTMQVRSPSGDDTVSDGMATVKLRPACDMHLRWQILETPNLSGRIRDINAAMDALRAGPSGLSVPSEFTPENQSPTGWASLLLGIVVPLLGALGFGYVFRSMMSGRPPHPRIRIAAGAAAVATLLGLGLQGPAYAANFHALRYVDNAALLALVAGALGAFAALGRPSVALPALAFSLSSGLALGVEAYLGWAPMLEATVALSLVLTPVGGLGIWAWSAFPVRSGVRAKPRPAPAAPARTPAPAAQARSSRA